MAKGKRITTLDPRKDAPAEIAANVLGPTGNLRAPAARLGKTWLIGFHADAYEERFG